MVVINQGCEDFRPIRLPQSGVRLVCRHRIGVTLGSVKKEVLQLQLLLEGCDGVVPFTVEALHGEVDLSHLLVAYFSVPAG